MTLLQDWKWHDRRGITGVHQLVACELEFLSAISAHWGVSHLCKPTTLLSLYGVCVFRKRMCTTPTLTELEEVGAEISDYVAEISDFGAGARIQEPGSRFQDQDLRFQFW